MLSETLDEIPDPEPEDLSALVRQLDDGDFNVTDWEASFLETCVSQTTYSPRQAEIIREMAKRYL